MIYIFYLKTYLQKNDLTYIYGTKYLRVDQVKFVEDSL